MKGRLLIGCFEIPGWGGASTAAYQLFARVRRDGIDAAYLNLIGGGDVPIYERRFGAGYGNPDNLPDVHTCELEGAFYGPHPELTAAIDAVQPDLLIGVGFIAALLMKRAAPGRRSILLTSGCQQLKNAIADGDVRDYIEYSRIRWNGLRRPRLRSREEREAVHISDLVMTHSDSTYRLYHEFFPFHAGKIHPAVIWFAEWIYGEAQRYSAVGRPFGERDVDVLFVASSWKRPEKNYGLIGELAARLPGARMHVVGEVDRETAGVTHHGVVTSRARLFELMGRTKVVASPSVFDAAPGVLFEASALGCNVVASANCGNLQLCHESLRAAACRGAEFAACIARGLSGKLDDNIESFLARKSYDELIETAAVV
jgi:glycosyltransferase involved in cell wall biosynthesis